MSIDNSDHYGQGMLLKRRHKQSGTAIARVKRSNFSLEDRLNAIANGDANTLIAIAEEYAAVGKTEMQLLCLKYAEQFTDKVIEIPKAILAIP
jgi:hypothetical protein